METRALVVFDGSTGTLESLDHALARDDVVDLVVLYVIDPFAADHAGPFPPLLGYWGDWYAEARDEAESTLADARRRAASADVPVETVVERGRTAPVAVRVADERDVDHVVVEESDPHLLAPVIGTTAQRIVRTTSVPVTIL